ncbi:hypothetical protein M011DRAFT_101060 [Sporormia fimetaria CBS 119925]|uniref:Uncharacterized protein n=1 Tax=Sporormia fimetaria CBS 119925 TaxID=1340428 RepID=A0A6A6VLQ4_9PLEO|nr:hypothetical protein M011DRAFT_101060 [Sporormia fimetaria CBS 119925]
MPRRRGRHPMESEPREERACNPDHASHVLVLPVPELSNILIVRSNINRSPPHEELCEPGKSRGKGGGDQRGRYIKIPTTLGEESSRPSGRYIRRTHEQSHGKGADGSEVYMEQTMLNQHGIHASGCRKRVVYIKKTVLHPGTCMGRLSWVEHRWKSLKRTSCERGPPCFYIQGKKAKRTPKLGRKRTQAEGSDTPASPTSETRHI